MINQLMQGRVHLTICYLQTMRTRHELDGQQGSPRTDYCPEMMRWLQ